MAVIASLAAALQPLAGRVQAVVRALRNRRAVGRLAELDAHQLKDIGLTRGQVTARWRRRFSATRRRFSRTFPDGEGPDAAPRAGSRRP